MILLLTFLIMDFFSIKEINEMRRQAIDELSNMIVKIKKS